MHLKNCSKCKQDKILEEFHKDVTHSDGLTSNCKVCRLKYNRYRYSKNPKYFIEQTKAWVSRNRLDRLLYWRNYSLKRNYGISVEDYDKLLKFQKFRCLICNRHQKQLNRRLSVDHCHKTGVVRGILCNKCNEVIGWLEIDKRLSRVVTYLKG